MPGRGPLHRLTRGTPGARARPTRSVGPSPSHGPSGYSDPVTLPSTMTRLAGQAIAARTGADLYRFSWADRIPDSAFASNSDGTVTVKGIDLLKVGLFNGVVSILDTDLETMVTQFAALRDAGIFLPPFRLDHSWSVLSVIGWFDELDTYRRVDSTDNLEKLFLRGDVRITGSVDYTPAQIVKAIKSGALRNRSSELGSYTTNAGVEIPLAYYGCAFVDIPAVEGLAPVQLSHATRSNPRQITNLNAQPEETHDMDPRNLARLKALRGLVAGGSTLSATGSTELADLENEATEAQVDDAAVEAAGDADEDLSVLEPEAAAEAEGTEGGGEGEGSTGTEPTGTSTGTGTGTESEGDEVAELRRRAETAEGEAARLRQAEIDRTVTELRNSGALVAEIEEDAVALLRHTDEDVRRRAGAILGNLGTRVNLSRRPGRTELDRNAAGASGGAGGTRVIELGMSKDEVGPLWAALTTEERKARQSEYDEWFSDRQANGVRE